MTNYYWIKVQHARLDNPDYATLPDRLWRRIHELELLAGRLARDGHLPTAAKIAWALRLPLADCEQDLAQLESAGLISRTSAGWFIRTYPEVQGPVPDATRKADQRVRDKDASRTVTPTGHGPVTDRDTDLDLDLDLESDKDLDIDLENDPPPPTSSEAGQEEEGVRIDPQITACLIELNVFKNLWSRVAKSTWTKAQILALADQIRTEIREARLNGNAAAIFLYRLEHNHPPQTAQDRYKRDQAIYGY